MTIADKVATLRAQGVDIPAPESIEIGDDVDLGRVRGPKTVLHAGTKLFGQRLLILPGARIGYQEPATVEDCAVGRGVELAGGYVAGSVFLDQASVGCGAQIRGGCLLEEEANGAHTVGLKQTVLLPFVTLGSLINFCDLLMAGGTSRKDHSEVGSSFIHFNFTPFGKSGDKATPSLVGDVPRGVMLRAPRIFLGGQAGLVGPIFIDYGTVLAAGTVYRRDHGPNELVIGEKLPPRTMPFTPARYGRIRDKVARNLRYIGNLAALYHFYDAVRSVTAGSDRELGALYDEAKRGLDNGIRERVTRLGQIAGYMEDSIRELEKDAGQEAEITAQRAFAKGFADMERELLAYRDHGARGSHDLAALLRGIETTAAQSGATRHIELMQKLDADSAAAGTRWLEGLVQLALGLLAF